MTMAMRSRLRNDTRRSPVRYECRISRSVKANQPELAEPLRLLKENTSNYIDYRSIGKIGVTIMMIEPVLRKLLGNPGGIIPKQDLQDFETELRENLNHAQYHDYDIPFDSFSPLALYGKNKDRLALQLSREDYRLVGDRAVVEGYIRDNYEQTNGRPVSRRFMDRNSMRLNPHITIGDVRYENMTPQQTQKFQADPSAFLIAESYQRMEQNREEYGLAYEPVPIIFPEVVVLNGLRVFCQQKQ